jgi:predicted ATPase with chaperone activity
MLTAEERTVRTYSPSPPPPPQTDEQLGLEEDLIVGLILKMIYRDGPRTGSGLSERLAIPFGLLDPHLHNLQQRLMIEVKGTNGHGRQAYTFDLSDVGRHRAQHYMERNRYVGPAPVPLDQYNEWVERQSVLRMKVRPEFIREAFQDLVLPEDTLTALGPAVNSGRSLFLYGDPGNGKTAIAARIQRVMGESIYVPYAIQVDSHTVILYDPVYHKTVEAPVQDEAEGTLSKILSKTSHDRRFVQVLRPTVFTGGELTLDQLDLQYDRENMIHRAPFQMKANGGLLVVDDFGRQRMRPSELLNRWIVPLEQRIDFMTLQTGTKFPVPFDALLVFATNLDPEHLVEEAFLRRIHYKANIPDPTPELWREILEKVCIERSIPFHEEAVEWVYDYVYGGMNVPPRACHPRDIVDHIEDMADYLGVPPQLTPDFLKPACDGYFTKFQAYHAAAREGTR